MENAELGNAVDNTWLIERADLGFEFMMNTLRLTAGFETKLFQERTGMPWDTVSMRVAAASKKGLITQNANLIQPTLLGQRYLNNLLEIFLS
jgi:oxygen-independent coproporphyrinogen-3 oxidase